MWLKNNMTKKTPPTSNINPLHISSAWKLHYFQNQLLPEFR